MAMSKQDQTLGDKIKETTAFVIQIKADLEQKFGMLYSKGKPKELTDEEEKELEVLYKSLEDIKKCMEIFKIDSSKVCGIHLLMRPERGRYNAEEHDSGIGSRFLPTPNTSANRLSNQLVINVEDNADLPDPSVSGKYTDTAVTDRNDNGSDENTTRKSVPSFYIQTTFPSTTSLNNQAECVFPPTVSEETDKPTAPAELNALSKNSSNESNEDNTEQSLV